MFSVHVSFTLCPMPFPLKLLFCEIFLLILFFFIGVRRNLSKGSIQHALEICAAPTGRARQGLFLPPLLTSASASAHSNSKQINWAAKFFEKNGSIQRKTNPRREQFGSLTMQQFHYIPKQYGLHTRCLPWHARIGRVQCSQVLAASSLSGNCELIHVSAGRARFLWLHPGCAANKGVLVMNSAAWAAEVQGANTRPFPLHG
jgi:hypothetical protein